MSLWNWIPTKLCYKIKKVIIIKNGWKKLENNLYKKKYIKEGYAMGV